MNGFYAMYFTGKAGRGHAIIVMRNGLLAGADTAGGILDGSYEEESDGGINVSVEFRGPNGISLVTGFVSEDGPIRQCIKAKLPSEFRDGKTVQIQSPTGPINLKFQLIRDVP